MIEKVICFILSVFYDMPKCNSCGRKMKLTNNCNDIKWYTCDFCGNTLRETNGKRMWHSELFPEGKKRVYNDYQRANISRGEELDED